MAEEFLSPIDMLLDEKNVENIKLYNEDNQEVEFEQIALIPLEDKTYAILKPTESMEGIGDDEALVFVIDENGLATVSYTCIGYRNITTSIVVTTKIEKKTLWWWSDVDGAEWTDQSNEYYCAHDHSIQLSKSGTYRATITYTVYGSGGEADVITSEIEKKY